jgi:hypothetical protein
MTYSTVACKSIGTDLAENTIPLLLFMGHCLVTAGCCDSIILALNECHNIYSFQVVWQHYFTLFSSLLYMLMSHSLHPSSHFHTNNILWGTQLPPSSCYLFSPSLKLLWPNLRHYPAICMDGLRKTMTNISQESWSTGQTVNLGAHEYEASMPSAYLWHSAAAHSQTFTA